MTRWSLSSHRQDQAEPSPADLLQELLKEIRQQSDGFKHFPEEEERGLLVNLFDGLRNMPGHAGSYDSPLPAKIDPFFPLKVAKPRPSRRPWSAPPTLSEIILSLSRRAGSCKEGHCQDRFPLEKFLALIEPVSPGSQREIDFTQADYSYPDHQDDRSTPRKRPRPESQYKAKGDLIIEDLFSDE